MTNKEYTKLVIKVIRQLKKFKTKFEMLHTHEQTTFTYPTGEIVIKNPQR